MTQQPAIRGFLADPLRIPPLVVTFQFNPASLKDNKSLYYHVESAAAPTDGTPRQEYQGGGERTISFSFQLHGLEESTNPLPYVLGSGIMTELAKLRSFLYPREDSWSAWGGPSGDEERGAWLEAPPRCIFGFGGRILECIVRSIDINETQFNRALDPVRADVSVTLSVIEESGNALYELDRQRRIALSALGLANVRLF